MRKTLRRADLVTFPCARLRDYVTRLAGVQHTSVILPHVGCRSGEHRDSGAIFNLVHAGKLGQIAQLGNRRVNTLLSGLARFLASQSDARPLVQLTLVGPADAATHACVSENGLSDVVRCVGQVSYEESLKHIGSATVCVLVEGAMAEGIYLPSKLVDYIAARKPVLALSPSVGTVADMLPEKGLSRVDPDDAEGVASALGALYGLFRRGTLREHMVSDALAHQFRPDCVARQFISAVCARCPDPKSGGFGA
jgi:hypothetical protein